MLKRYLRYLIGVMVIGISVPMLLQLYSDDTHRGIVNASESPISIDSLARQLDTTDRDQARSVIRQLGDTKVLRAIELLEDVWNRGSWFRSFSHPDIFDDPVVRLMLARQLLIVGKNGDGEYGAYIKSQAYSSDWIVRANAADALAVIDDIESVNLLHKVVLTPHRLVALRAIRALDKIAQFGINYDRAFSYLDELKDDTRIDDEVVRKEIIDAHGRFLEHGRRATADDAEEFTAFGKRSQPYPYRDKLSELTAQAESGSPQAQHILGERYLVGVGVEPNLEKAKKWLLLSVAQNYAPAKASLAQMYLAGRGVEVNRDKAIELLEEGVLQGDTASQKLLEMIKSNKSTGLDSIENTE